MPHKLTFIHGQLVLRRQSWESFRGGYSKIKMYKGPTIFLNSKSTVDILKLKKIGLIYCDL